MIPGFAVFAARILWDLTATALVTGAVVTAIRWVSQIRT